MAGKFGADFNASQPSDADLVKKGAQWIRDIKSRIKTTFGVIHNNETGQLLDNVVGTASLKDLNPDPTGTWDQVDVNEKGQVTAGRTITPTIGARLHRWTYLFGGGWDADGTPITAAGGMDTDGKTISTYSFVFPAGVTRIFVRVQGAGGISSPGNGGGGGGGYCEATIDGSEGDVWLVWVGESAEVDHSAMSRFYFSAFRYMRANGGYEATIPTGAPTGGDTDVAGEMIALEMVGGAGTSEIGGPGGCGCPSSPGHARGGYGAMPGIALGGDGFVTVDYWTN